MSPHDDHDRRQQRLTHFEGWQPVGAPPRPEKPRGWFRRHRLLTAFAALAVLAGVVQLSGGSSDSATEQAARAVATSQPTAQQPAAGPSAADRPEADDPKPADAAGAADAAERPDASGAGLPRIGTAVRDGKFEFTVTKVDRGIKQVGGDLLGEKAQGRFALVHVTVKNIGDESQLLDDTSQVVRDATGREFDADSVAAMSIEGNDVFLNEINPGNTVKGVLVYDMPKDAEPASIELHDSMYSGGVMVSLR
jgi:hypothetical protein